MIQREFTQNEIDELYRNRLLVFLETAPQSNKYFQVYFSPKDFERVLNAVDKTFPLIAPNVRSINLHVSNETYDIPDLKQVHE